jgi:DNA mismatch endonuclease, patch repair protein
MIGRMADTMTPAQRSRCMARVRSKHSGPEIRLRKALWAKGLRYRLHQPLPGRPDMLFVRARVAVFVDGCFWHGCPEHHTEPKTNSEFWRQKLQANRARDNRVNDELQTAGWTVVRLWQHTVDSNIQNAVDTIILEVRGQHQHD